MQALESFQQNHTISRWWVAHSGGLDSQVLLHLAAKFIPKDRLGVLHVNHGIQQNSKDWECFSKSQANTLGIAFKSETLTLKKNTEDEARRGRYAFFERVMSNNDVLLMGHHADDQAETVLFRQLRGTSLQGLTGIPESRTLGQGQLLRPLLSVTKTQLKSAAQSMGIEWVEDPSNAEDDYDRNYLRNRVFPVLNERWPSASSRFAENASRLTTNQALLDELLADALGNIQEARDYLSLVKLKAFSPLKRQALIRLWVRQTINEYMGDKLLSEIERFITQTNHGDASFELKSATLQVYRHKLYLVPCFLGNESERHLEHEQVRIESLVITQNGEFNLGDGVLYVEGLQAGQALTLQRRQGGEKCKPQGDTLTRSVKKLLQDSAILPWHRQYWPLLYFQKTLAVIPNVCLCESENAEKFSFSILWRPFSLSDNR